MPKNQLTNNDALRPVIAAVVANNGKVPWGTGTGSGLPAGGSTGQALTKSSNADYAVAWSTVSGGGGGSPNLDGGKASTNYGGITAIDCGTA